MSKRQQVQVPLMLRPLLGTMGLMARFGNPHRFHRRIKERQAKRAPTYFEGYTPTANDIFVATAARSGTHWMMQIALQTIFHGEAEYDYIYDMVSWPEYFPSASLGLTEPYPQSPSGQRLIKTHLEAQYVPVKAPAKYISVIRDPKEYAVSTYHFVPQALAFINYRQPSLETWIDLYLQELCPIGSWPAHTASWWSLRERPNVMVIPFNGLKADTEGYIDQIANFLEVELSPEARSKVIEKSSYKYMRTLNDKLSPIVGKTGVVDIVRKGEADGGKATLTAEMREKIDAHSRAELKRLGSDFPYDELFG